MLINSPLVCICIPTYNVGETIGDTLISILNQSYVNIKILVVDNGSKDETLNIVKSFKDARISIYENAVNCGGISNFNRCVGLASGEYTAIYHADDVYEPTIVYEQVRFLEVNARAGAVFTQANLINENNTKIGEILVPKSLKNHLGLYDFPEVLKAVMQYSNFLVCPTAMLRTKIYLEEIKTWRGDLFNTSCDLDVWFRVLQKHAIGILPERLINYRISQTQDSSRLRARVKQSDMFLVMEYYLAQAHVKKLLDARDYLNYRRLERTDMILRAVNLFLRGDFKAAKALCENAPIFDVVKAALTSRRGFVTGIAILFLRMFLNLNKPRLGQFLLVRMKNVVGK